MSIIYLNGRPLTVWQKVLAAIFSIGSLIFMFTFGLFVLAIGAITAVIIFISVWWRMRKIKKQYPNFEEMFQTSGQNSQHATNSESHGETIEGSYKKL